MRIENGGQPLSNVGAFEELLASGQFTVTASLSPPDSADPEEVYSRARVFDGYVDAICAGNVADRDSHMSALAVCALLAQRGYATIMPISCRNQNRLAVQSDVLGAAALGVSNVLCLSSDDVQRPDDDAAEPVFDRDCASLVSIVRTMRDESRYLNGRAITTPPRIFLGAASNPYVESSNDGADRLAEKIAAGAAFVQTQYCFDVVQLEEYMQEVRDRGLHEKCAILVGVAPLDSARAARWMRENMPGVTIPDHVVARLEGADRPRLEGRRMCMELIQQIRDIEGVAGVHVMAHRQEEAVAEIIDASGVLAGRMPWNPANRPNLSLQRVSL